MCERKLAGDDDFGIVTYWVHKIAQKENIEWAKDRSESWVTAICKKWVEQWSITSQWSEWSSSKKTQKNQQIINAGEGVERREPSYTVGGNVIW